MDRSSSNFESGIPGDLTPRIDTSHAITRRQFLEAIPGTIGVLVVGGLAGVAGVALADVGASARANSISIEDAATVTLPKTRPWAPNAGEIDPSIKARATLLLESVGAWTGGRGTLIAAQLRASAAGFNPNLVEALAALYGEGESAVIQVRDAQYGGILGSSASVLVVVDQWRLMPDGSIRAGGTTVDVRLAQASPHWRIVKVLPAHPGGSTSHLSLSARRVLSDSRIRLPYAARADVKTGRVHDSVLQLLLELSALHFVDISVIRSGHPLLVFGTSKPSDHPRGRAVDIWALDSRPLVVPSNHLLATSAMRFAASKGAYNVGGPVLLRGPQYFSDRTHQDHIHLGFND